MKKFLFVALLPLALLTGCNGSFSLSGLSGLLSDPKVSVCASALIQTGITDPGQLAAVATSTPACIELAADVVQQVLNDVLKQNVVAAQHARIYHPQ